MDCALCQGHGETAPGVELCLRDVPKGNTLRVCVGGGTDPGGAELQGGRSKARQHTCWLTQDSPAEVGTFGHYVPGKSYVLASLRKNLEME